VIVALGIAGWIRTAFIVDIFKLLELPIEDSHHFFPIARAGCDFRRHELIQTCKIVGRELNLQRGDVLLEIFPPLGSWDRNDVVAFRQHPGERELCRLAFLFLGNRLDARQELQVLRKVVALETRERR